MFFRTKNLTVLFPHMSQCERPLREIIPTYGLRRGLRVFFALSMSIIIFFMTVFF